MEMPSSVAGPISHERASFIARELRGIEVALRAEVQPDRYQQLYAAQQALAWALDPEAVSSPSRVISEGRIQAPTDTLAG
jgi:hypothetical protein